MVMCLLPLQWLCFSFPFLGKWQERVKDQQPFVSRAGGNASTRVSGKKLFQKRKEWLWYFLSGSSLVLFVTAGPQGAFWVLPCATCRTETWRPQESKALHIGSGTAVLHHGVPWCFFISLSFPRSPWSHSWHLLLWLGVEGHCLTLQAYL